MTTSNKNLFKYTFAALILVEALSFLSFQYPVIAPYVFGAVALVALIATIKNLEWGVSILFAELVIGSFGKILVLPLDGWQLPIRMVIWVIVMAVWIGRVFFRRTPHPNPLPKGEGTKIAFFHSQLFKPYLILAAVLGWGIVWGLWRGNNLGAVFFDVNNYLYFALVFPVYDVLSGRDPAPCGVRFGTVIMSAITWLSVKTILLFYIFSHELFGLQDVLYAWSRRMQLAEITNIDPNAIISRIFIQSQIWILFGLFVVFGVLFMSLRGRSPQATDRSNPTVAVDKASANNLSIASFRLLHSANAEFMPSTLGLAMTVILSTALIMSFSRSFWLAGLVSLVIFCGALLFILREKFKAVFIFGAASASLIGLAILLTLGVAKFPFPPSASSVDFLKNRASQFKEAAANSRVAQIRPLLNGIANHPAIGSGFGTSVTYQSQDPRVLKNHPDGWYTTTAFELGWLEMWLKIGLVGVGAYLYLLWKVFKAGWRKILSPCQGGDIEGVLCYDRYLILGGLIGLIAVVITHGVSPYLNHPLGIGVVILLTAMVDKDSLLL